jgi:hypothetical protein
MSSNELNEGSPEPQQSKVGAILALGIVAMGVIWTYIFFGYDALGWWAKAGVTAVILPTMVWAWRWRRQRISRQLDILQRWADEDDAKASRRRRRPA